MIHKLIITGNYSPSKIMKAEVDTRTIRFDGLTELFIDLIKRGFCESYSKSRIYYMAYLLSEEYPELEFEIKGA